MRGKPRLGAQSKDIGLCESWWPATNGEGGTGPENGQSADPPEARTAVAAVQAPRPTAARWPVGGLRRGLTLWVLLTVAGWGAAGAGIYAAVHANLEASRLAVLGGFTPVQGPGVELMVADGDRVVRAHENPRVVLVQDGDLIFLNMMLWYGGAQAVSINGERITAQSTITSSGPTLLINQRRVVGPFLVLAVGDPEALRGVLEARGGIVDRMTGAGLKVDIVSRDSLSVPGANSGTPTLSAEPSSDPAAP